MTDEVQSPTVKIDDKEYLEADLSKEQMELLNMAKYLAPKEQELNNKLFIQDHKRRLINELKNLWRVVQNATIIETKGDKDESS